MRSVSVISTGERAHGLSPLVHPTYVLFTDRLVTKGIIKWQVGFIRIYSIQYDT